MKSIIPTPHDRFFRNALSDLRVAKEFFKTHLPESIQQLIDFDKITPCKESYVDAQLKLSISDMLFTAQFNDGPGYIYLLNEHLSHPRKMIAFYLLKSMIRIMDEHLKKSTKLPIVYPLVFYTGKKLIVIPLIFSIYLKIPP